MKTKKKCPKCEEEYDATLKCFNSNKSNKDGLTCWCKKCRREYYKKDYKKLSDRKDSDIIYPKKKRCSHCGKIKFAREFNRNKGKKDGLDFWCKDCSKQANAKWRQKHKKELNKKNKKYYREHKEEINQRVSKYRYEHKREANERERKRRSIDLNFKMRGNLRSRLRQALKSQSVKKTKRSMDLIGCSVTFLKKYLKSKFSQGMNWNNYGSGDKKWCIDHIKPCAFFDLTKEKEQKKCFHYTNLQPLWNKDNWSKNSFYNEKLIKKGD